MYYLYILQFFINSCRTKILRFETLNCNGGKRSRAHNCTDKRNQHSPGGKRRRSNHSLPPWLPRVLVLLAPPAPRLRFSRLPSRGYGDTDTPADIYSYTYFHVIGDLIGVLGADKVFVVGHDWNLASMPFPP